MSRIGKRPIPIPSGVTVESEGHLVRVMGPKGELARALDPSIQVNIGPEVVTVTRPSDERRHRSLHGLTRTLIANMVDGVTKGFEQELALEGTGYRATKQGSKLSLTVGFSHPVEVDPPAGIVLEVPRDRSIVVRGINKELVGQVAANIRAIKPPEPYLGKGVRYSKEKVRRKAGKTGKK